MTQISASGVHVPVLHDAWPSRYLAEELWLRGRRQVALGLVQRGLFLPREAMAAMADRYQAQGRMAYERLIAGLPPPDCAFLGSELVLGPASGMLAERAPIVLAFGEQVAEVLGRVAGGCEPNVKTRHACARVNFLVSLFDLVTDRPEAGEGIPDATTLLDGGRLDAVLAGPAGCAALRSSSLGLPLNTTRVFGLLTAGLFTDLHRLRARVRDATQWAFVEGTVRQAYVAQAESRSAIGQGDGVAVARRKSVLPLMIMGEVVAFADPTRPRTDVLRLAEALGEVFWRADDLADVGSDWMSGDVNSVLASCDCPPREATDEWIGIAHVLDSGVLERASDELLAAIDHALDLLREDDPHDRGDSEAWLTWYVIDWLR